MRQNAALCGNGLKELQESKDRCTGVLIKIAPRKPQSMNSGQWPQGYN